MGQMIMPVENLPPKAGSLVGPVGANRYGWPIFQYLDPQDGQWHHVVRLPDGRVLYSDAAGDIGHGSGGFGVSLVGSALAGAAIGMLVSPIGAVFGGIVGGIIGDQLNRRERL